MKFCNLLLALFIFSVSLTANELSLESISSIRSISEIRNPSSSGNCLETFNYSFNCPLEEIRSTDGSTLKLNNTKQYFEPTKPIVPQKNFHISLSGHYKINEITVNKGHVEHYHTFEEIAASDNFLYTDGDLHQNNVSEKDKSVYEADAFYPNKWLDFTGGFDGKQTQIYIHVFPVQWNPVSKETYFLREFELSISGEKIDPFKYATKDDFYTEAEHIILSSGSWMVLADSIAEFHNIPSAAINVDSIYAEYEPAEDPVEEGWALYPNEDIHDYQYENALRIISYLRDLEAHPNLEYITVLGGAELIPPSYYFSFGSVLDYERWLPSDHYFASPDYDWIDNYATTRIPVHDIEAASVYFNKMRNFVDNSSGDWTRKAVVSGGQTWGTSMYFGEMSNNQLICDDVFDGCEIQKFQEMRGNFFGEDIMNHWLNEDFLWYFNFSHGGGYDMVFGDGTRITNDDVQEWPAKERVPIIVDKACWNGVFDTYLYDHPLFEGTSFCEHVLSSPGGGIAYVAATRQSSGQPVYVSFEGNIIPYNYSSDYALLYLFLREYRSSQNPTFGNLFKNAKNAYLEDYSISGYYGLAPFLRFVVHADAALELPIPLPINSQTDIPNITLENGQIEQYSQWQYAGININSNPRYFISNEDNYELLSFSFSNKVVITTSENITNEFSLSGDICNQIIINRLNNVEQKERWHYSCLIRTEKTIDGQLVSRQA
ncbi:MAG: C25 family cysteine peptidase [Candidatus Cloacimonadales bacterium]|nr:C25 family cysteine peptidase [Candidatus Cloacimonadales bacterium]